MAGKVLTEEERAELIAEYIESHTNPNLKPLTQAEIGKKYGVSQTTVSNIMLDSGALERVRRRTRSNIILAQAIMESAAPEVAKRTVKSAMTDRDEKFEYITQGDRRDVLDRAGGRAAKEEKNEVTISFASGGIDVGMPESAEDE